MKPKVFFNPMIRKKDYTTVAKQLREHLAARFDDVDVQIGDDIHYKGVNVVITTRVFDSLLPEQRFHHVVRSLPPEFYEKHLRSGVVWFELAPKQAARDYMKMPRSEDVAAKAERIEKRLTDAGFNDRFAASTAGRTDTLSRDDFVVAKRLLAELGLSKPEIQDAALYFILRGSFCDADLAKESVPSVHAVEDDDD